MQLLAEECVSHMLRVAGCILHRSRSDDAGSCSDLHPRLRAIMMCMVVCAKKCDSATYVRHRPGEHGVYAGNDGLRRHALRDLHRTSCVPTLTHTTHHVT